MKILMLVNWKIEYCDHIPTDKQPPDYYIKGQPYWFFRYFPADTQVDVVDIRSFQVLEKFEHEKLRFYIWQTIRVIPKLNQYDLVISHGMQSGIALCLWRRLFGKGKYRHIVFDIGAFNSAKESGKSLKLMQFVSKSIDGVIYHTPEQIHYYEKCHPWLVKKSKFVTFGTDPDFFSCKTDSPKERTEYILCIGYNKRDWNTLVTAYQFVPGETELRMIGRDDLETEDTRINLISHVSIEQLKSQIVGALFCVLPLEYLNYSFGQMTLLQQMALGKAVIAADVPSIEPYKDNVDGTEKLLLYPAGNVKVLTDKIKDLLQHPDKCKQIGEAAAKSVKKMYNEETMAKQICQIIKDGFH